jgi:hypothetical protein
MTDEELTRLQELCDNASRGPWEVVERPQQRPLLRAPYPDGYPCENPIASMYSDFVNWKNDALFIIEAREAMPQLLAEVARLRAENQYMREHWNDYREYEVKLP